MTKSSKSAEFGGLRLVAGHPALDFVNTVKFRGYTDHGDRLTSYEDILNWSLIAGIIDRDSAEHFSLMAIAEPKQAEIALEEILKLREFLRAILPQSSSESDKREEAAAFIDEVLLDLARYRTIDTETLTLRTVLPCERPGDLIFWLASAIEDLMKREASKRIGCCEGHDCDWTYLDSSRGPRRRWCDSRTCGNTARVRKYRDKNDQ